MNTKYQWPNLYSGKSHSASFLIWFISGLYLLGMVWLLPSTVGVWLVSAVVACTVSYGILMVLFWPFERFTYAAGAVRSMTIRTIRKTITFLKPFFLKGVDRLLPPRDYNVVTDEELLEGLSFSAYRRVSTTIFVPAPSGSAIEMVTIDPLDLQAAQDQDAMPNEPTAAR